MVEPQRTGDRYCVVARSASAIEPIVGYPAGHVDELLRSEFDARRLVRAVLAVADA